MKNKTFRGRISVAFAAAVLSTISSHSAIAAPGTLAKAPLFLSTIVEPNVFFTLDDSGSMAWEFMVQEGTAGYSTDSGKPEVDGRVRSYYTPDTVWGATPCTGWGCGGWGGGGSNDILPPSNGIKAVWDDAWVFRTHHGNSNYYNPNTVYTPWVGLKADGTAMYPPADENNALKDPTDPTGDKTDLTKWHDFDTTYTSSVYLPTYYKWDDTDGDGLIESSDGHTRVEIAPGTDEMQNFANWFVYYRTREYAAKASIGRVINNTDSTRMGLDVFNGGHLKDSKTMSDITFKRELLETFYNVPSSGFTPARRALERVGDYFMSTNSRAPILSAADGGECQQNFNILMTDGFWNGSNPGGINNADGDDNTDFDGDSYADSYSNTLADVAMYYYETDLRTLADKVPTMTDVDENNQQHLVTYSISWGMEGTLDPFSDDPTDATFSWPDAHKGDPEKIDDLWHAAYNSRGEYLSAQNPDDLENSLNTVINNIADRTATAAAVSINSAKLTTESVVYAAQFNTNRWQGDLFAYSIIIPETGPVTGELSAEPKWSASDVLTNQTSAASRVILTYGDKKGIPFEWGELESFQQDDLRTSPTGTIDTDLIAQARLNYLRGDRSNEGAGLFFRERASLLGDLVNSGPVFVGAPSLRIPDTAPFPNTDGTRYTDFKNGTAKNRKGVVYAGANDGMLHGFDEVTGKEVLAYIPGNLFASATAEGLHYLTDPNYQHRYYNDLTPTVSDIYANIGGGLKWNTVLVSGQRGGGRGIYALDVTNPALFSDSNAENIALWEFADNDLGFTYSIPQIGMVNDNSWVAIFGNGYNDTGDGEAKLFILDIAKGADGEWETGDFRVITTGSGSAADRNGLATPALADTDGDGTIDRAYAGDLKGQMWAFDLSDTSSGNWGVDLLFTTKGNRPITAKPTLARHPNISTETGVNEPNILVLFGSGQYLVDADKSAPYYDDYFYGVWDKGDYNLTDTQLVEQTYDSSYAPNRVLTKNVVNYSGGEYGWYLGLPDTGERSVTRPVVRGKVVFFNTFVPNTDPCSVGGYGYRFAIDIVNGGATEQTEIDVTGDGVIDEKDEADNGIDKAAVSAIQQDGFLPEPVFIENIAYTGKTPSVVRELPEISRGRFSWQELIQ